MHSVTNLAGGVEEENFSWFDSMLQLDLTGRTDVLEDGRFCFEVLDLVVVC